MRGLVLPELKGSGKGLFLSSTFIVDKNATDGIYLLLKASPVERLWDVMVTMVESSPHYFPIIRDRF